MLGTVTATTFAMVAPASADTDSECSAPTRAVCAISDAGTDIIRDRDGDYTTATHGQDVTAYWAASNNTDQPQTVRVLLELDGPGTSQDRTLVAGWELAPDEIRQGSFFLFKTHKRSTPLGTYTWSVTATGTEQVTASSEFTVY